MNNDRIAIPVSVLVPTRNEELNLESCFNLFGEIR